MVRPRPLTSLVAFTAMVAAACDGEPGPAAVVCAATAPLRLTARTRDGKPTIAHISVETGPDSCALAPGCVPGRDANSFCAEVHLQRIRLSEVCRLAFFSPRGASFRARVAADSGAAATCVPADTNGVVGAGSESIADDGSSSVIDVDFPDDTSGTGDTTTPAPTPSNSDSSDPHSGDAPGGDNGSTPNDNGADSSGSSGDSGDSSSDD